MSVAKKAVDSTLRRILNYTAEIFMSIILLVLISIPLVLVIPMWFQHVVLGLPRTELALDPVVWFGLDGAFWFTLLLTLASFFITYVYILKMKPGVSTLAEPEPIEEEDEDEPSVDDIEEVEEEEVEEEVEEEEEIEEEEEEVEEEVEEDSN